MNTPAKLFLTLTLFCIGPVLMLGFLNTQKSEVRAISATKKECRLILNTVADFLKSSPTSFRNIAFTEIDFSTVENVFKRFGDNYEVEFYLFSDGGKNLPLPEKKTGNTVLPAELINALRGQPVNGTGTWKLEEYESDAHFVFQAPIKETGVHLILVKEKRVVSEGLSEEKVVTLYFLIAAAIAIFASGLLVYGHFSTQIKMVQTFVGRLDEGGHLPREAPSGDFHEVCATCLQLATRVQEYRKDLLEVAVSDQLTGVFNKKNILGKLTEEVAKAQRYETPLSVILLNMDSFSRVNESYSFEIGDQVLCRFAAILQNSLRTHDIVGRYDGDEFLVLLPLTDAKYAHKVADRIRAAVEVTFWGLPELQLTVSGGMKQIDANDTGALLEELVTLLGNAKQKGGNCIEPAREELII